MLSRLRLPMSLSWFALTGVLFLLQAFPYTGIFLMLLAAPFWSILTVNIGFACLTAEALVRPGYRLWLIAPALYLGGYLGMASISQHEADALDREFKANNAGLTTSYSRQAHDIVVETPGRRGDSNIAGLAPTLVRRYGAPAVFVEDRNLETAAHRSYRIAGRSACDAIRRNKEARAARVWVTSFHEERKLVKDLCTLSGPENPTRPAIRIGISRLKNSGFANKVMVDEIVIRDPAGHQIKLMSGSTATLPWWPKPVIGCALNSGAPSWNCSAGFMRDRMRGLGAPGGYGSAATPIIATALGLSEVTLDDLRRTAAGGLPATLSASVANRTGLSSRNLDRIIDDPTQRLTVHDLAGMRERPDLWQDRIPQMMAALERAMTGDHKTRERANMLQDLFAALPDDQFRPLAGRIASLLVRHSELPANVIRDRTLERLSILGAEGLPALETRLNWVPPERGNRRSRRSPRNAHLSDGVLLGLCRIGPPAAHLADKVAASFFSLKSRYGWDKRFLATVTLLRMGREDLAHQVHRGQEPGQHLDFADDVIERLRSASTSDDCVGAGPWRRRVSSRLRRTRI